MNLNYGGTKRTIDESKENAIAAIDKNDKLGKQRADAISTLVDTFLKDKSIAEDTTVNVTAVATDTALSVNITLNQATFVPPVATVESDSKPLTKKAEREKQEANAKSVTKKVERIRAEDATDGTIGELNRQLEEEKKK